VNQKIRLGSIAEPLTQGAGPGREVRHVEGSVVSQRHRCIAAYKCHVLAEDEVCTEPRQAPYGAGQASPRPI
jgi:hypothetical protein